jgi:hypothetical protein
LGVGFLGARALWHQGGEAIAKWGSCAPTEAKSGGPHQSKHKAAQVSPHIGCGVK